MYTLYPHQNDAVNSIYQYFLEGNVGNPLVAMPTGTGKSLVIGDFIKRILAEYPKNRIACITHVKELIKQNSERLVQMWEHAPYGIYSAGLHRRESSNPIIYGGIASMIHDPLAFGHRDLILIDEAHLLGPNQDAMYNKFIAAAKSINPYVKTIGFTATAYRLGQGLLTDGDNPLFTDFCFDITGLQAFNQLIADGYLSPPISKRTVAKIDLSNVALNNQGEYELHALEEATDHPDINRQVCLEMCEYGADRRCWLVFAAGVDHAEHIAEILNMFGIPTMAVHSKMPGEKRDKAIADYKAGKLRCLVNNNVLTTGFDHRPVDFIGMLRATMSTGLWVQMLGRGTRPSPETGKTNCLTLDFVGNTRRLGPINDPLIPVARGKASKTAGVMPTKICDACNTYNHVNAVVCAYCGAPFPSRASKLEDTADTLELLRESPPIDGPIYEWFDVQRVLYAKLFGHNRVYLQCSYVCGVRIFYENVFLEGENKLKGKAVAWWKRRMGSETAPPTIDEALKYTSALATPTKVQVQLNAMLNGRVVPKVIAVEGLQRMNVPTNANIWWNGATTQ